MFGFVECPTKKAEKKGGHSQLHIIVEWRLNRHHQNPSLVGTRCKHGGCTALNAPATSRIGKHSLHKPVTGGAVRLRDALVPLMTHPIREDSRKKKRSLLLRDFRHDCFKGVRLYSQICFPGALMEVVSGYLCLQHICICNAYERHRSL